MPTYNMSVHPRTTIISAICAKIERKLSLTDIRILITYMQKTEICKLFTANGLKNYSIRFDKSFRDRGSIKQFEPRTEIYQAYYSIHHHGRLPISVELVDNARYTDAD